jgi:succinoglycan biosynthesis transport protein ExoP
MTFSQFLIILRARWVLMVSIFLGVVLLVLAISLLLPKRYTASASVVIDVKSPDPMVGMVLPGMMQPGYIATQLDVLQSERVTLGAIRALRLEDNQALRQQWQETTNGVGSYGSWLADLLQRGIDIKPSRESSVINISYSAADPNFAAALANAYVRSYIETTLELRVEPAKQYSTLFGSQAKLARDRLEAAQGRLSAYQKERGLIIATDERLDVETARLGELSSQLVALQAFAVESASRKSTAGANSQEVLNNPVVAGLKSDLSRQEARLKELSARYGPAFPQVQELQANITELRTRIDAEVGRVTSSFGINNTVNQSRESQLRAALEQQRQKLLKLKEQRDEAAVLLRDVESAQRAYETITSRFNQASVESQSNQTNVSVLKEASAPSQPSAPRTFLNMILAVLVGSMLALASALMAELRDRRMRSEFDVVEGLELPLLGVMPDAKTGPAKSLLSFARKTPQLAANRGLPELTGPGA